MAARSFITTEYNEFLFATIGEEKNETPLSVLSALTRLDVDPWREAARLSQLPKEEAIKDMDYIRRSDIARRSPADARNQHHLRAAAAGYLAELAHCSAAGVANAAGLHGLLNGRDW